MHDISKKISGYIENHFPAVYREDGPVLVDFVQAYFEFLERNDYAATKLGRSMFANRDIDETLDAFIIHFKEQFLNNFVYSATVDKRFIIKHIMDFYRSKGTPRAAQLLIRMIFNQDSNVYLPGRDILKPSDSKWTIPRYLELSRSTRTSSFIDQQIKGSKSGATAFVESVVRKRIQGRLIDIAYLSSVRGTFLTNELVTNDSSLTNAPKVIGSLSGLTVVNGGKDNVVGDLFNVIDDTGKQGVARVTGIENATGRVDFDIVDGGSGYTLNTPDDNDPTNDYTNVRVATAMIYVDNSNTSNQFIQFETVRQSREQLTMVSGEDLETQYANTTAGDYLLGVKATVDSYTANSSNGPSFDRSVETDLIVVTVDGVVIANSEYTVNSTSVTFDSDPTDGSLVKLVNYTQVANGIITSITDSGANTVGTVVVTNGTFRNQLSIDFANNAPLANGEIIYEEQTVTLTVDDSTDFTNGEIIEMRVFSDPSEVGNTVTLESYAYGTISSIPNSSIIELSPAFGTFLANASIIQVGNTSANGVILDSSIDQAGAIGVLSGKTDANTWVVRNVTGEFTVGKLIRGQRSLLVEEISAISNTGATDVWYNGNPAANGVIDTIANTSVSGIVVGQNTTCVGLYGNTSAFSYVEDAGITITTVREEIKEHDLVGQPNISPVITNVATGEGATFQPGSLENEETVTLNIDLLSANNIANVAFMDVTIDGSNSGVGFVDSFTVHDGGTGYTDGQYLVFSNGGYANGDPLITASAYISVTAGVITSITVENPGEAYYDTPTFTLPDNGVGNDANVSINMDFGYGFAKNPTGDSTTIFADLFSYDNFTMGTISSLTRINPGVDYNADPFVSVHNPYVAGYERKNILLGITVTSGSFAVNDVIYQGGVAKGLVITASETQLTLKRVSFNTSFNTSQSISGSISNATASVNTVDSIAESLAMGENAIVTGTVIVADGVATGLEIIDSGYGYLGGQSMTLSRAANPVVITATSVVETQGIGTGYWTDTTSHLNSEKKIHDNKYYQEYSYDVQTGISLDKYKLLFKEVIHVAGTEIFGTVIRNSNININMNVATSSVATVTIE